MAISPRMAGGAGCKVLVRQFGYATAARYLDNSEQMVRERYSHIEAGEQVDLNGFETRSVVQANAPYLFDRRNGKWERKKR